MDDRVSLYPGRVTMTPVAGQVNTYDMVRADDPTQAGTPLNKATLLKDATAALFGLGASAVPDDVLAELGKYKQYWWRRRTPSGVALIPTEDKYVYQLTLTGESRYGESQTTINYSSEVIIDENTKSISLKNPQQLTMIGGPDRAKAYERCVQLKNLAPVYITIEDETFYSVATPSSDNTQTSSSNGIVFYLPAGIESANDKASNASSASEALNTVSKNGYGSVYETYIWGGSKLWSGNENAVQARTTSYVESPYSAGDWEYIHSSSRSAYPDSGTSGGYEYEYLGVPLDNAVNGVKIETGNYVGTGTYGEDNQNVLTFDFVPRLVVVTTEPYCLDLEKGFIWKGEETVGSTGTVGYMKFQVSGKALSWVSLTSAAKQLNVSGTSYYYAAIG